MKFSYWTRILASLSLMFGSCCVAQRDAVERCDAPMVKSPLGKYCYDFQPNAAKLTWIGTQDFCETKGGNLGTLHSVQEVKFLLRNMVERKIDTVYLGFRAFKNRSKWVWLDDKTEIDPAVVDWSPGQPDYQAKQENCGCAYIKGIQASLAEAGKILHDISCDAARDSGFLCKIPLKLRKAKNRKYSRHHHDELKGQDDDDDDDEDYDEDTY